MSQHGQFSEDGQWWWDGQRWRPASDLNKTRSHTPPPEAASPHSASTSSSQPQLHTKLLRHVPGFRSATRWKQIVATLGYLVIVAWIVQLPWNPALGILGLLSLAAVLVAANSLHLRMRLPGFRSPNKLVAGATWSGVAVLFLITAAFAQPSTTPGSTSNSTPTSDTSTSSPGNPPGSRAPRHCSDNDCFFYTVVDSHPDSDPRYHTDSRPQTRSAASSSSSTASSSGTATSSAGAAFSPTCTSQLLPTYQCRQLLRAR